jgi:hypothetical protein
MLAKFQQARQPAETVVIDETMIPFRGRLKFRQFIKIKAHKYGAKVFKVCDQSGYTYNLIIYSGKQDRPEKDLATDVMMKLME